MTEPTGTAADKTPPPKGGSTARSAASTLATRLVVYPLGLVATIVVARVLGPTERGLYAILLLFGSLVLPMCLAGFGGGIVYYLGSRQYEGRDVAISSLVVGLLLGLVAAGVGAALWHFSLLGDSDGQLPPTLVLIMLGVVPVQSMNLMSMRLLYGQSRFTSMNFLTILQIATLPVLLLFFVGALDIGLAGAVLASAMNALIIALASFYFIGKIRPRFRLHLQFIRAGLSYGLKAWIGQLASRANIRLDQYLLALFASPADLGRYTVAVRLSEILWILADGLAPPFFNRMASAKDRQTRLQLHERMHRLIFAITAVGAVALAGLGWIAIPYVFGDGYAGMELYLALLLPGTVIMVSPKVITKFFLADNRPGYSGMLGLVGGIVGVAGYIALVPAFQVIGAAVGASIAYGATALACLWLYSRCLEDHPSRLWRIGNDDFHWGMRQIRRIRRRRAPRPDNG